MQYRQGDILLEKVSRISAGVTEEIPRVGNRIIIAQGEATGHHHAIATETVKFVMVDAMRYLVSDIPFEVMHEEHASITVPEGVYRVIRQRVYQRGEVRNVVD